MSIKDKLNYIADYYKKQYHLKTNIDIVKEGFGCYFKPSQDYIFFSIDFIKNKYIELGLIKRFNTQDINKLLILGLLHEVKHSIQYKNNSDIFDDKIDKILYKIDKQYHDSVFFEVEADRFALEEAKKWLI